MKIIQPREISGKIMTLIELANEKVVLVSPYVQVEQWAQMKRSIEKALKRGVEVEFYTRSGEAKSIYEIEQLGLEPFLIEDLHAKIYMNEKRGIITSQNLYLYSDINSLDIGVEVEGEDFTELHEYYQNYVLCYKGKNTLQDEAMLLSEDKELFEAENIYDMICMLIERKFNDKHISYYQKNYEYNFQVGSRTFVILYDFSNGETFIEFESILTGVMYDYLKPRENEIKAIVGNDFYVEDPGERYYQMLRYRCKLPERKLKYCSKKQLISVAKKVSAAFIVPMMMVKNSGDEAITRYL